MEFQGAIDISKGTPNFNPDTSVESQLNNNGTALGPLPGSGKLGEILICLLKTSNYLKCLKRALQ
jgi:hypothetical protein